MALRPGRLRLVWLALGLTLMLGVGSAVAMFAWPHADPDQLWKDAESSLGGGRIDDAEARMRRLAALRSPTVLDWLLRGQVAMARNRTDEAIADLRQVPNNHPMAPQAWLLEGQLELRRHRTRAAEAAFLHALKRDPELAQARRELIYIYGMQLRRRELCQQFEALSKLTPITFKQAFDWCLTRGVIWEPTEVAADLEKFLAADPDDRWSRLALAESLRRPGRLDEAEKVLSPLPSSDVDALAIRARIALDRGDEKTTAALLAEGSTDHPGLAFLRGRMALARHDTATAVRQFRIAHAADPEDRDAVFFLGNALRIVGKADEAEPFLETARRQDLLATLIHRAVNPTDRDDPQLPYQLGRACEALHRYPEARAWYNLAIGRDALDQRAQQALFRVNAAEASEGKTQ